MTIPTDCAQIEDDLKAFCDGELSWPRRLAVRAHLTRCASCRKEVSLMTQIAEDLRASENAEALDPALRAKIVGIAPPAPTTIDGGVGGQARGPAPTGSSLTPPELGAGGRKRPALGWAIAGAALVAWFLFFPIYQRNLVNARHANRAFDSVGMSKSAQQAQAARTAALPPTPRAMPALPPAKLGDAEIQNGAGSVRFLKPQNGAGSEQAANSLGSIDGHLQVAVPGNVQTLDINNPSAFTPLRQVHKEASIGVQVPNPETASDTVETMVKETGGYVASNNLSTGDGDLKTAELVVKVPVTQFETFLSQTAKLGNVLSKNISGEDITEKTSDADQAEIIDEDDVQKSEARLKSLGSRAKWHDEEETRDARVQLAQSRARLVLLKRLAALGTITVDLSQTPPKAPAVPLTGGFLNQTRTTTHDALQSLLNSANALLALAIWLLAYAPIWIPLLLIGRYALREYHKRATV